MLRSVHNRVVYIRPSQLMSAGALNTALPWQHTEAQYSEGSQVVYVDEFLKPRALREVAAFLEESTVWHNIKKGFLASYMWDAFANPVLLQVADELRQAMPGTSPTLFGGGGGGHRTVAVVDKQHSSAVLFARRL